MAAQLVAVPNKKDASIKETVLYPLRFAPIFQYRLWGGRRLANWLSAPLPAGLVGEAWLLSDREDHASRVTNGSLKGRTISALLDEFPEQLMGGLAKRFPRFPLLLKLLDAREMLSIQVHPSDSDARLVPAGETGKTEAWVVLETGKDGRIYDGLKPGTTALDLRRALTDGTIAENLRSLSPKRGDAVFIPAGTVHSLGDVVVFEIQQNSDVTFRLYDWDRVDGKTGQPRELQVDQAFSCIDFKEAPAAVGAAVPGTATYIRRERLFQCDHFELWRLSGQSPFTVGAAGVPRILVCIDGAGQIVHGGVTHAVGKGDVFLLPAQVGVSAFQPRGGVTLFEISIPDSKV